MATSGWEGVTARAIRHGVSTKPSKYRNKKTTADGIQFDSAKEARRYQELLNLVRVGDIRKLRVQPHYTLCALVVINADPRDLNAGAPSNRRAPVCEYFADFEYEESDRSYGGVTWTLVVEDVKSVATRRKDIYRLKKKMFEIQYGIQIREV